MTLSLPPRTTASTTSSNRLAELGSAVQAVQVDLRTAEGVEHLYSSVVEGGRTLSAAALNAGVGRGDMFLKSELSDDLDSVDLNVRSTVHLAKLVLRATWRIPGRARSCSRPRLRP
jgi:short-subunit dehydrogenase